MANSWAWWGRDPGSGLGGTLSPKVPRWDRVAPRANALNSAGIIARALIGTSVQAYDSSGIRPEQGGIHGRSQHAFDQETLRLAQRSPHPSPQATPTVGHHHHRYLWCDRRL